MIETLLSIRCVTKSKRNVTFTHDNAFIVEPQNICLKTKIFLFAKWDLDAYVTIDGNTTDRCSIYEKLNSSKSYVCKKPTMPKVENKSVTAKSYEVSPLQGSM